jgi:hypothetical protein
MIGAIPEENPLRKLLGALADESEEVADNLKQRLTGWFDEGMIRISGWYNRQAKLIIFAVAAVSLGAPFWFDLFGRITKIKGSGGESGKGAGKKKE